MMLTFLTHTNHIPYPPDPPSGDHMVPMPPDLSYHLNLVTANCEAPVLFKVLTLYIHLLPRVVTGQRLTVFTTNLHYDTLQEPHNHTRPHPHLLHLLVILSPDNRHIYIQGPPKKCIHTLMKENSMLHNRL